ncbi:hypothetical protein FOA24_33550 [Bacillus thuringiensis]|uniref:hypothetical protein n=1 Tax=Bacillus thuringiensis TaxID=1428 RepID=UPI00333773E4
MKFKRTIATTVLATATLMGGTSALASSDTQDSTSNLQNTSILASSIIQNSASNLAYPSWGDSTVWFNEPSWGQWEIAYQVNESLAGIIGQLQFINGSNQIGGGVANANYRIRILSNNEITQQGRIGQWHPAGGNYFANYQVPNEPYVIEISPSDNYRQYINFYHRTR